MCKSAKIANDLVSGSETDDGVKASARKIEGSENAGAREQKSLRDTGEIHVSGCNQAPIIDGQR